MRHMAAASLVVSMVPALTGCDSVTTRPVTPSRARAACWLLAINRPKLTEFKRKLAELHVQFTSWGKKLAAI